MFLWEKDWKTNRNLKQVNYLKANCFLRVLGQFRSFCGTVCSHQGMCFRLRLVGPSPLSVPVRKGALLSMLLVSGGIGPSHCLSGWRRWGVPLGGGRWFLYSVPTLLSMSSSCIRKATAVSFWKHPWGAGGAGVSCLGTWWGVGQGG